MALGHQRRSSTKVTAVMGASKRLRAMVTSSSKAPSRSLPTMGYSASAVSRAGSCACSSNIVPPPPALNQPTARRSSVRAESTFSAQYSLERTGAVEQDIYFSSTNDECITRVRRHLADELVKNSRRAVRLVTNERGGSMRRATRLVRAAMGTLLAAATGVTSGGCTQAAQLHL